jgi:hypothetical protein
MKFILPLPPVLAVVLVLCVTAVTSTNAAPKPGTLHFGWADATIAPGKPVAICGQYGTRISGEVHDPVRATALAIETRDGEQVIDQAVIVSCDLVAIRGIVQEKVRKRVEAQVPDLDVHKILLSATHTHTAPALTDEAESDPHPHDFLGSWAYRIPVSRDDVMRPADYIEFLARQISDAVVNAWKARKPGGMSHALGHAVVAHNRRAVYADGTARMYGDTSDPKFSHIEGTSDHSVDLLFFWRGEKLAGIAIAVYCPSQEVESQLYLSADYWYDTRKILRDEYGEDLHVLSLCGTAGDQSPHLMWNKNAENALLARKGRSPREEIADRILLAVDQVIETSRKNARTELQLQHRVEVMPLPVWEVSEDRYAEARTVYESGEEKPNLLGSKNYIDWRVSRALIGRYKLQKSGESNYKAELHFLRLGDVAVATNPFECYTDYGLRIKARSPAVQTIAVQLTAGCAGYLPTKRAVAGGGYSARIVDGVVGPEGGDVLVDQSAKVIAEMWTGE